MKFRYYFTDALDLSFLENRILFSKRNDQEYHVTLKSITDNKFIEFDISIRNICVTSSYMITFSFSEKYINDCLSTIFPSDENVYGKKNSSGCVLWDKTSPLSYRTEAAYPEEAKNIVSNIIRQFYLSMYISIFL